MLNFFPIIAFLCFVPISMHVVFVEFITILLFVHHMFTKFGSSFKVASISNIFLPLMLKVVSSAYISISDVKFLSGRSFINIIKSRGSKMDRCGTPYFTGSGLEMLFPIHKLCVRSDRYDYLKFADRFCKLAISNNICVFVIYLSIKEKKYLMFG